MSATTTEPTSTAASSAAYVAAVAEALAGVPEPERQELLDDLADHLAELAAEDDEALDVRLGSPETYAAELVASAGITVGEAEAPAPTPLWRRTITAGRALLEGERVEAVRAFLPELRPGWWVLRGWCLAALLAISTSGDPDIFPVPAVSDNPFVSAVALVAACVASVRIGRTRGWIDRATTVVGVVGLLMAAGQDDRHTNYMFNYDTSYLQTPDGRVITNIWPYDSDGQPLDGVLLLDQDGMPLEVPNEAHGGEVPFPGLFPRAQRTYEYDPVTGGDREVPVTAPIVSVPGLPTGTAGTDPDSTTTTVLERSDTPPDTTTTWPDTDK